jgi:uncharacterized repeat protein (TIGR01451 family)
MKRLPFRRGVVLVLALAVLAATAMAVWLGVFHQERAAAAADAGLNVSIASGPVSGTTMAPGSVISYVVTVNSDGATDVADDDITLEIALENATFVGGTLQVGSGITCNTGADPIDCDIPEFIGAGSKTVSFDATVGAAGPVRVGAAIDPPVDASAAGEFDEGPADPDFDDDDGDDPDLACATVGEGSDTSGEEDDNFDCTSHAVANADLTVTKTASPLETTAVAVGSVITYTLTASNDVGAAGTASNVVIRDYIGTGLTFESAAPGSGVICGDTTAPEINCTAASIAPGESRTVVIVVTVSAASGAVLNGARVDPTNAITEDDDGADDPSLGCGSVGEGSDAGVTEPDNYDCTSHIVTALPDLTITKTASPSETTVVDTGDTITYTLTVTNGGAATATSVDIQDTIGSGLSLSSVTPGTGVTCGDTTAPEINCVAASIASGESRTVTIVVTVSATSGTVLNGAEVDPDNDIAEVNEDADDPTLDCSAVGEGTDAGDATEADNYDCSSHAFAEVSPTPTAGQLRDCPLSGKWAMSVWDGPSGTATGTALATCTGVTIDAAYSLDRVTNSWSRYFPGRSDINTLLTLSDMQAIFTRGQ